jgi:predicted dehydrogenase
LPGDRLRLAVVGCGDVARRRYLPTLAEMADRVDLRACCDPDRRAAERAARLVEGAWPDNRAFARLDDVFRDIELDAVVNLTPAPVHAEVTEACLQAGLHVYSEKPLASTIAGADRLIGLAKDNEILLLCAPGVAVTKRIRWLVDIVASGRLGQPTLAVAQHADTGPATWREYTGDPSVFYGPGVGPVFDHGVYRLHAMTTVLGPVRRVQAMGTIAVPRRLVRAGPLAGRTIDVRTPDHVLINLEFANGALGQLLASFAAPATQAPWLELHCTNGTVSFPGESSDPDAPVDIYLDDDSPLGLEGWTRGLHPPPPGKEPGVVEAGIAHFVGCLFGEERPVLTAEHARHVLDVILKAYDSIRDGQSHATETTF